MARNEKNDAFSTSCILGAVVLTLLLCYWRLAPMLAARGVEAHLLNKILVNFRTWFSRPTSLKAFCLIFIAASAAMKTGKKKETTMQAAASWSLAGTLLYLMPTGSPYLLILTSFAGLGLCIYGYGLFFRKMKGGEAPDEDSFLQCDEKIESEYSVNIPYHYTYQKKRHDAWINLVAPFRGSIVMGVPGSGKSFAIYNKCIEDMVRKNFTYLMYDFKFPDLSEELLNEIYYQKKHENLWAGMKVKPKIYVLNFDDPKRSNRCNPIDHTYITDMADTTEIADLIFKNINKGGGKQGFDFFNESAKVYLDALIWFLANYDPDAEYENDEDGRGDHVIGSKTGYRNKGCYCTFPHVIELMAYNYKKVFQILQYTKGLEAKISPFTSALDGGAMEQLQGQIASAQIPMGKFVSPALYWIMTGDDFTLDINNPEEPKIVCLGNNPDRQAIYGSAIALYTSRAFKLINHKHKLPCAVLFDELPTVFIKGLDNLIATARSNKVAIILGAQDRSQLKRDYGDDEAKVIFSTVGNILSGQVNEETAEALSKIFGKEFREQHSKSISDDSDSTSISFQLQDIMPASKIGTLTQGTFFGRIADNFDTPIEKKLFCGAIDVDFERAKAKKKEWQKMPIITDFFGGKLPELPEDDRKRLELLNPNLKGKEDELLEKYIDEKVNEAVMANFNSVKNDIKMMVEKEYERTLPFAERAKEEDGTDDDIL